VITWLRDYRHRRVCGLIALIFMTIVSLGVKNYRHKQAVSTATAQQASAIIAQRHAIIAPAIIDSVNDITKIPALQAGVVNKIHVKLGQRVKKGELLFELDDQLLKHALEVQKISLKQAEKAITLQEKQLKYAQHQLNRLKNLDARAFSQLELSEKRHEVAMAKARLQQVITDKQLVAANYRQTELTLDQFKVFSPRAGVVLQINAHRGEFMNTGQAVLFLGDAHRVIVRVSIDEREAYRFQKDAPAYLMNNRDATHPIPMKFLHIDQYIVLQERLNTRVQEVVYSFPRKGHKDFIAGQLFDVSIDLA